jgi:outer membrane protein assembly factor BamB
MLRKTLLGIGLMLAVLTTESAADTTWPQWRGPKRDDVSTDTGLLKKWPEKGPQLIWDAVGAGRGYASVVMAGGRIYTMGDAPSTASDKDEYALCFDEKDGKQLWKSKIGPAWNKGQANWQSSRSTPTLDGDMMYLLTPHGQLVCLKTADGKEVWHKSMQKDFGGNKADGWGYSESVLIDGDTLVCTPGGGKSTMVGLNKKTGATIWKAIVANDRGAGHASPVISEIGGTRIYVQMTGGGAMGVRAKDGKLLWNYPIDKTTAVIPTPIIRGDLVFFTAGYNRGGALLRQVPNASGVKIDEVYGLKKTLANKHGGVVLIGDYLYGDTDSKGSVWCAELKTGTVMPNWQKKGSGRGSAAVTAADGHLYVRYDSGTMVLALAAPAGYKEVSSFKVPHSGERPSWAHPVVAGGKMFLREGDHILCYNLEAK